MSWAFKPSRDSAVATQGQQLNASGCAEVGSARTALMSYAGSPSAHARTEMGSRPSEINLLGATSSAMEGVLAMASLAGDDTQWQLGGYGVLGAARPRIFDSQDGPVPLNDWGVWGLLGTDGDIANYTDLVTSNDPGQPLRAAIGATNALAGDGVAVYGECRLFESPPGAHPAPTMAGFIAGTEGVFGQPVGVFGQSENGDRSVGVMGFTAQASSNTENGPTGVLGTGQIGVRGETSNGVGVLGRSFGSGVAGRFIGDVSVEGTVNVTQDVKVSGDLLIANGRDICERFPAEAQAAACGHVMVAGRNGALGPCVEAYDRRVVGVVSGAGTLRPAITLGADLAADSTVCIALVGTACCWVDADFAPVTVGDLLTTSTTPGHAMRASDEARLVGTIVGKALASLACGRALLPMVITLR